MTFKESIITCIQYKYADFKGRASRSEYWYFFLFNFLVGFTASLIDSFVFGNSPILYLIVILGLFIPGLAVGVRRLHDIGKSGWWILIALIPIVGIIVLIVFYSKRGEEGANEYGEPVVS